MMMPMAAACGRIEGNQAEVIRRQRPNTVAKTQNCAAAPSAAGCAGWPATGEVGHRADAHE